RHELREHAGAQVAARLPGRAERDGRCRARAGGRVLATRLAGRDLGAPLRREGEEERAPIPLSPARAASPTGEATAGAAAAGLRIAGAPSGPLAPRRWVSGLGRPLRRAPAS